jgi:2-polyprenyl-6-methoxyphenol hydroxylase-like FAD-dependent oxidoreductase
VHAAGLEAFRQALSGIVPWLQGRAEELRDWKQFSLLAVESDRLPRWYAPDLRLIGDAAHVMSPIGGNGINYAVQDAAAAANILSEPLKAVAYSCATWPPCSGGGSGLHASRRRSCRRSRTESSDRP